MKATILQDGTLKVIPESKIEAYALRCWHKEEGPLHIAHDQIEPPQGGEVE